MSNCLIEFGKDGDRLMLRVFPPDGGAQKLFIRQPLELAVEDMDEMRRGEPSPAVINRVTAQVSEWLLRPDPDTHQAQLDLAELLGLDGNEATSQRLLFSTREVLDKTLRAKLSDIPVELLVPTENGEPFITHRRVAGMVHLLPKPGNPPVSSKAGTWPFRVLIVRSNPDDLGGAVPKAAELREHILALRPDLKDFVVVDVLTSEDNPGFEVAGRPTKGRLLSQLERPYDILVYLGHGDMRQPDEGTLPIGVLMFENEDGTAHEPFDSKGLSSLLHINPVPVVLLVGCLTAAELRAGVDFNQLKGVIPDWMRGSQGVAQALIDGQSGVRFVVGMRYRVEREDALSFLKKFFSSVLSGGRLIGNVEAAVRAARAELKIVGKQQISWAAPVVFRMLEEEPEPTFRFLTSPPSPEVSPQFQEMRSTLWETLKSLPWSMRPPAGSSPLHANILGILGLSEQEVIAKVGAAAAILMPDLIEVQPDLLRPAPEKTPIVVPVRLHRPLSVRVLRGTLIESSGAAPILEVRASPLLEQAGFELSTGSMPNSTVRFRIDASSDGVRELPAGVLFEIVLSIGPAVQTLYIAGVSSLVSDPVRALAGLKNAVIVPSP